MELKYAYKINHCLIFIGYGRIRRLEWIVLHGGGFLGAIRYNLLNIFGVYF